MTWCVPLSLRHGNPAVCSQCAGTAGSPCRMARICKHFCNTVQHHANNAQGTVHHATTQQYCTSPQSCCAYCTVCGRPYLSCNLASQTDRGHCNEPPSRHAARNNHAQCQACPLSVCTPLRITRLTSFVEHRRLKSLLSVTSTHTHSDCQVRVVRPRRPVQHSRTPPRV